MRKTGLQVFAMIVRLALGPLLTFEAYQLPRDFRLSCVAAECKEEER